MTGVLAQRVLALAGASVLAALIALAVSQRSHGGTAPVGPQPALGAGVGWTHALVGVTPGYPVKGKRSRCGWILRPETLGVVHPVLPCGAKLFVDFAGRRVLTEVVDRAPVPRGEEFAATIALADRLGLSGVREVKWSFARE